MKKLLLILLLALGAYSASALTTVVNATTNGFYLISTNRASVYSITVSGANSGTFQLYDCDSVAAPFYGTNYTNASFTTRVLYATNIASSFVGITGVTNWSTNAGIYSLITTNAAGTKALPAMVGGAVAGGTFTTITTDALFSRGICGVISTNLSLIINYNTGQ